MSGGAPIAFTVNLTEADLTAAFRLHTNLRRVRLLLAAFLLIALIGTWAAVFEAARQSLLDGRLLLMLEGAVVLMLVLLAGLYAALPFLWRRMARRTLAQRADIAGPIGYELSGAVFIHSTPFNTARLPWSAFSGWRETDTLMLLYISDQMFHALPKA